MKKILLLTLLFATAFFALAILYVFVEIAFFTPHGYDQVSNASKSRGLILAGFSLLGILSKSIFDALRQKNKKETFTQQLIRSLSPGSLLRSILISPIVILSLYNSLQQISDSILIGLIAYQNGFFFETVLKSREEKVEKID